MGRVTIGARRIPLVDFVGVCLRQDTVQVDPAQISKIEADLAAAKPKPSNVPAKIAHAETEGESLSEMQSRAAVLQILIRLVQGKYSVRSSIMISLADILNDSDTRLSLPVSDTAIAVSSLLSDLTTSEYEAIKTSFSLPLAISTCSSFALMQMISWSDVIAALTLEGCAAKDSPLEAVHHEDARPHPGQLQSVANIRTLLKGSQFIGKSGRTGPDPISIRCVPQYHGPARDMIANVARSLTIELNSAQHTITDCVGGEFHAQSLSTSLYLILSAAAICANGSRGRLNDLIGSAVQLGLHAPTDSNLSLLQEANSVAEQVQDLTSQASSLISKVTEPDLNLVSRSLSSNISQVEQLLKRLFNIEIHSAMEAIQQRIDMAQSGFTASEENRRSRMQDALAKVQAQLKDKPDDARLQKQAQGLSYQPRVFSYSLGSGVSAVITRFKTRPVFDYLEPYSTQFAEFVDNLLMVTNEGKKPKRPKGTRDFGREDMMIRERVFEIIRRVFQSHGATGIDTPVFELKETLMGKYGEDSKLIYDLADQGGEQLSLRYDLTVPLARYLASNNISQIKRYHIARVYRRDNPAMNRGRFREFYQCDFDIAGHYDAMIPDAECLAVMCDILSALDLQFSVKFSHRVLLDAVMSVCDVPSDKFRTICSAIDKLDKETWATVREEMLQKGLDGASADKLEKFVEIKGEPFSVLESLRAIPSIAAHKDAMSTLSSLETLFKYLEACDVLQYISFDLSLARGLDYYTGAIYEAVLTDTDQVGSIAAGGRYDKLVGMFLPSNKQIPAVGVSIGIERIFTIIQERERKKAGGIKPTYAQVLVGSVGGDLTVERFRILKSLWNAGISAELVQKRNPYFEKQLEYALDLKIPFIVLVGQTEIDNGVCNVKNTLNNTQETIPQSQLVSYLQEAIANLE